jgi:hypothetical protein
VSDQSARFSIVDRRPEARDPVCQQNNVVLLTYGTVRRLAVRKVRRPQTAAGVRQIYSERALKYKQMIDVWGGWTLFQNCSALADRG